MVDLVHRRHRLAFLRIDMGQLLTLSMSDFSCQVKDLGASLVDDLSWFLKPLVHEGPVSTQNLWTLRASTESASTGATRPNVWSAPRFGEVALYETPLATVIELSRQRKEAIVYDVSDDETGLFKMLDSLDIVLGFSGFLPLHCAAFRDKELGVVLVIGPSGAGKSSVMKAFLAEGAEFIADDRVFYDYRGSSLKLYPFRGFRKVEGDESAEKSFLDMQLIKAQIPKMYVNEGFTPDLLLFPQVVAPKKSQLRTFDSSWQTFQKLIAESYVPTTQECSQQQMLWLRKLISLPAYELHLGADKAGRGRGLTDFCKSNCSLALESCQKQIFGTC